MRHVAGSCRCYFAVLLHAGVENKHRNRIPNRVGGWEILLSTTPEEQVGKRAAGAAGAATCPGRGQGVGFKGGGKPCIKVPPRQGVLAGDEQLGWHGME